MWDKLVKANAGLQSRYVARDVAWIAVNKDAKRGLFTTLLYVTDGIKGSVYPTERA